MQRYRQRKTGLKRSFFDLTDQFREGYVSLRLKEFVAYYAGRISYEEVEALLRRTTGAKQLLSDQKIQQLVVQKAASVSRMQQAKIACLLEAREMPEVRREVDLYSAEAREVVLMEDGIQVKQQKAQRERRGTAGWRRPCGEASSSSKQKAKKERVSTDVAMLEKREGGSYAYLCGGIDDEGKALYGVVEAARAAVVEHYGGGNAAAETPPPPLAVVAITDGAQNIRSHLEQIFGSPIPVILDWYHLTKKVYQLLSMVAHGKDERERMQREVMGFLWRGGVGETLSYLRGVSARRVEALRELVGYLEKHGHEIIDYERRSQRAGKTIGSGRMEKGVDQVIGYRQKKKGMSWSEKGSKALGILRVVELNGQWEEMWFGRAAA